MHDKILTSKIYCISSHAKCIYQDHKILLYKIQIENVSLCQMYLMLHQVYLKKTLHCSVVLVLYVFAMCHEGKEIQEILQNNLNKIYIFMYY